FRGVGAGAGGDGADNAAGRALDLVAPVILGDGDGLTTTLADDRGAHEHFSRDGALTEARSASEGHKPEAQRRDRPKPEAQAREPHKPDAPARDRHEPDAPAREIPALALRACIALSDRAALRSQGCHSAPDQVLDRVPLLLQLLQRGLELLLAE